MTTVIFWLSETWLACFRGWELLASFDAHNFLDDDYHVSDCWWFYWWWWFWLCRWWWHRWWLLCSQVMAQPSAPQLRIYRLQFIPLTWRRLALQLQKIVYFALRLHCIMQLRYRLLNSAYYALQLQYNCFAYYMYFWTAADSSCSVIAVSIHCQIFCQMQLDRQSWSALFNCYALRSAIQFNIVQCSE